MPVNPVVGVEISPIARPRWFRWASVWPARLGLAWLASLFGSAEAPSFVSPPAFWRALSTVESRDRDTVRGAHGEISRYQITPDNWRRWARAGEDPTRAADVEAVGRRMLASWERRFQKAKGRPPHPAEWYALWHRPGAFARAGWRLDRLPERVRQRCTRFAYAVHGERGVRP